jgi:PIN domain nuclease of toxin-antitoxin system
LRLLLDTCTFLWAVDQQAELSAKARSAITDPSSEVYVSAISAWEIAVKQERGNLALADSAQRFVPKYREMLGFLDLALDEASALRSGSLPPLHRDPFDRMLVCQAIEHGLVIVTPDAHITQYPIRTLW